MIITGLDIIRYTKYKVYFEKSKIDYQIDVDYIFIKDLEKKFKELYNQVIYCFVNKIMIIVKLRKYKDFLVNQKYLANYREFFYYNYNLPYKKHCSLDNIEEDLQSTIKPRT